MLVVGTLVGGLFAAFSFAISAFSIPMLLDERLDAFTAMGTSMALVWNNLPVMLVWGTVVLACSRLPGDRAARPDPCLSAARPRHLARLRGDPMADSLRASFAEAKESANELLRIAASLRPPRPAASASATRSCSPAGRWRWAAPDRPFGAGHALRRLHPQDRDGAQRASRVVQARVNLSTRRVASPGATAPAAADPRDAVGAGLQGASPTMPAEGRTKPGSADPRARGRRFRVRQHHGAVGLGLVGRDRRDARPVPLDLGGDRAAGAGLFRPDLLRLGVAALRHGRPTWTCRSRSACCSRSG